MNYIMEIENPFFTLKVFVTPQIVQEFNLSVSKDNTDLRAMLEEHPSMIRQDKNIKRLLFLSDIEFLVSSRYSSIQSLAEQDKFAEEYVVNVAKFKEHLSLSPDDAQARHHNIVCEQTIS
ncbi:Hypothetical protein POVR1_LOCUS12 [uncultured virus]|nr:Hypothetical protein POVR1_LOCUS12 [uncultured virus]